MEDVPVARRRLVTLLASSLLALATALVGVVGIASAHTPTVTFSCVNSEPVLSINLLYYQTPQNSSEHNTVSASIDGSSVLATTDFTNSYSHTFTASPATVGHTASVVITAWD